MATVQAHSQVHPVPTHFQAIFAARWRPEKCRWCFTRYMLTGIGKVDDGVFHARNGSWVIHQFLTQMGDRVRENCRCREGIFGFALDAIVVGAACGLLARGGATPKHYSVNSPMNSHILKACGEGKR